MKSCDCPDWEPNIKHINYMIEIYPEASTHFYDLTSFKFCPFCGRKLRDTSVLITNLMNSKIYP